MSVRTCQFCGKPLSRIWTGGGDYCSREHRNQHRLRLGMDRLQEANKVASLMRRRENLKPINSLQPVVAATLENRAVGSVKITSGNSPVATFKPSTAALRMPRIISEDNPASRTTCLPPVTNGLAGVAQPKEAPSVRLESKRTVLVRAPRRVHSAVQLAQAPITALRATAVPAETDYRTAMAARNGTRKPYALHLSKRLSTSVPTPFHQSCRPRPMFAGAVAGMDLRVSKSQGFRLPKMRTRAMLIALRGQGKLAFKPQPIRLELEHAAPEPEPSIAELRGIIREPRLPGCRMLAGRNTEKWPPVRVMKLASAFNAVPEEIRVQQVAWNTAAPESSLKCEWYQTNPRITMGYAEEPKKKAGADSAKATAVALTKLQENFDSGCSNWVGGVADWKLDAAGARTGSLALYAPSMQLTDYEMEFLVRVENRTATWVFRATDNNDHYRATLRVTPEGGYEFSRWAVIGGKAEQAVSSPVAAASKTRTALAVRTSVKGNTFSVFVDGQAVDQWNDSRLPAGGVGFGDAPDDRARLYWVRVSYSEGPGLKDVKR